MIENRQRTAKNLNNFQNGKDSFSFLFSQKYL